MTIPNINIDVKLVLNMNVGDIVQDINSQYEGDAVVVSERDETAENTYIPNTDETVADANPEFSEDSPVVEIAFINHIKLKIPRWWMMNENDFKSECENLDVKTYLYPTERLEYVDDGLIDGVILTVEGVADPFSYSKGAYAFEISKLNGSISYTDSGVVTEYDKITSTVSVLVGILEGLDWIQERNQNFGVQIVLSDEEISKKLRGEYQVRQKMISKLLKQVNKKKKTFPKVDIHTAPKTEDKHLKQTAVETYNETEEQEYEIDNVIDEEYIVDGIFSVNLNEKSCTCDADGECEHIQAVEQSNN